MPVVEIKSLAQYKELLQSHPAVIIDASAEWCGPCKAISPIFEKLSHENNYDPEKVVFAKFDTDEVPDLAQELGIRSIPTFFTFKDGDLDEKLSGANPSALTKLVGNVIESAGARKN
ncbi:thioredoxin 1 [Fusarium longipes]|uniref:Thioredoxin n=1 Tax=Fusarium longipes TaxID=694270 RepID=A0A395RWW1_9HYPO|nr:thioredoxin 1 [Fusarium longipes]